MKIIKISKSAVDEAVNVLSKGGLVIYPTETIYGIGVDATNRKAIEKLTKYKDRPYGKPFSIAIADQKMAEKYVSLNQTAKNLYKEFLPGPVTIVSKGLHKVTLGVESETGTLGIRIPNYNLVIDIVKKLGKPITSTSANVSYKKRPYKISDVLENISQKQKDLIDLIIDAGTLPPNEPSTVIDTTMDDPAILRQGEIKLKDKVELLSRSEEATQNIGKELWQKYEKYLGARPIIFALEGPMGAGKTQFTKGLGRAMGIKDEIISPTFNLILEYDNPRSNSQQPIANSYLAHIDAWRLQNSEELNSLGFAEILKNKNSVIAIEWAERVADVIRAHSEDAIIIWVKIKYGKKENERLISWGIL